MRHARALYAVQSILLFVDSRTERQRMRFQKQTHIWMNGQLVFVDDTMVLVKDISQWTFQIQLSLLLFWFYNTFFEWGMWQNLGFINELGRSIWMDLRMKICSSIQVHDLQHFTADAFYHFPFYLVSDAHRWWQISVRMSLLPIFFTTLLISINKYLFVKTISTGTALQFRRKQQYRHLLLKFDQ